MCIRNHNTVRFTKVAQKQSSSLNCEHRIFTNIGSLKHGIRLMSNIRAVYTNLKEQGIVEQCQEQNKCEFWHTPSVAVKPGAWSYFCWGLCVCEGICCFQNNGRNQSWVLMWSGEGLDFSIYSIGADMMRTPSGETADCKAMVWTPFGIR